MTRTHWKALLIGSVVAGAAVVALVLAIGDPDTRWILALLVTAPFMVLGRAAAARLHRPDD